MNINIKLIFDRDDLEKLLKAEYQKQFKIPEGYELSVTDTHYGEWHVEIIEIVKPETKKEETTDGN